MTVLEGVAQSGVPSPGAARLLDVGTGTFLDFFTHEILDGLVASGGATCKIFEGANGSGKTHILHLLSDLALERGMAVVRTDLSQALSLEDARVLVEHVLQNLEACVDGQKVRSLPGILEAVGARSAGASPGVQGRKLPHSGFGTAMEWGLKLAELSEGAYDLLSRYLVGERIGSKALRAVGIKSVKNPLSDKNAELVLRTVLEGLRQYGVPGTLILLDEHEKTFQFSRGSPPLRVVRGANLMRRLIDGSANGGLVSTVVVFAVLPGFVESCALAYPALGQRLQIRRDPDLKAGWRWPLLPLEAVSSLSTPESFVAALATRLEELVGACGGRAEGIRKRLIGAGNEVLESNAGGGYRRGVLKSLTSIALACIES